MTYLIWPTPAYLLAAFLLGLLLSWWSGRRKLHDRLERLDEKWRLKHQGRRVELAACRQELEACRAELEERGSVREPGAEPVPLADPEAAVSETADSLVAAAPAAASAAAATEEPPAKEDLKKVEGIGPKIEGLLNAGGILTWSQLAAAEVSFLQSMLDDAGPRYRPHDPATWPRQARLASDGAWEELAALQDHLEGGRDTRARQPAAPVDRSRRGR